MQLNIGQEQTDANNSQIVIFKTQFSLKLTWGIRIETRKVRLG